MPSTAENEYYIDVEKSVGLLVAIVFVSTRIRIIVMVAMGLRAHFAENESLGVLNRSIARVAICRDWPVWFGRLEFKCQ